MEDKFQPQGSTNPSRPGGIFGASVPEKFPEISLKADEWRKSCSEHLKRLNMSQSDIMEYSATGIWGDIDIKSCLNGIRAPTIFEEIDENITKEMKDYESKLDPEVRLKLDAMKKNKRSERKLSRFACRTNWISPEMTKSYPWSECNIIKRRRLQTRLRSYALVHDFNDSKFKKQFVSQNFATDAHGVLRRQHARERASIGGPLPSMTLIDEEELIVTISFYQPTRGIKIAEFDILGSQTLADLKDAFFCDEDVNFGGIKYKGACFFINGAFYADTRDPHAPDYSYWIGDYLAKRTPQKIKQRTAMPVHETRIRDMTLILNQKGAYLHQGDCEHRVTATAVRAFDRKRDCLYKECYPLRIYEPTTKTTMCQTCTVAVAERLIFNASLLPFNPTYLCRLCADFLLYDEEGRRIESDDFIQFDYQDVV